MPVSWNENLKKAKIQSLTFDLCKMKTSFVFKLLTWYTSIFLVIPLFLKKWVQNLEFIFLQKTCLLTTFFFFQWESVSMNRTLLFLKDNLHGENNFHSSTDKTCVLWPGSYNFQFTRIAVLFFPQEFFYSILSLWSWCLFLIKMLTSTEQLILIISKLRWLWLC